MSLERTLQRARVDAERGDLAGARDRLLGLLSAFPTSLEVRRELGELYWRLGDPARAGCMWYLEEPAVERMTEARRAFERRFGGRHDLLLRALKVSPEDAVSLPPGARSRFEALAASAWAARGRSPWKPRPAPPGAPTGAPTGWRRVCVQYGCMALLAAVLVLAVVGLLSLARALLGG